MSSRQKPLAFSRLSRLPDRGSFDQVFANPLYTKKTTFVSVFAAMGGMARARLGIVVAKRNVRLAVQRNKLKRMIREAFRLQQPALTGLDLVVVVKRNFAEDQHGSVDISNIFKRVGEKHVKQSVTACGVGDDKDLPTHSC